VGFAHQKSCAAVLFPHAKPCNGGSPVPELMKYLGDDDIVWNKISLIIGQKFGHGKERNPPHSGFGPLNPGQHEMDHIVHPIVVSG